MIDQPTTAVHHSSVAPDATLLALRNAFNKLLYRQGFSRHQINSREHQLNKFIVWANRQGVRIIDDLDGRTVNDYRRHLDRPRRLGGFRDSPVLQAKHLNTLRIWLAWIYDESWTELDLSLHVGEPYCRTRFHRHR